MALVKEKLVSDLLSVFKAMRNETDSGTSDQVLAIKLATVIDSYIRTADVAPGIPVSTTGSPTAQTGLTTGTGKLV